MNQMRSNRSIINGFRSKIAQSKLLDLNSENCGLDLIYVDEGNIFSCLSMAKEVSFVNFFEKELAFKDDKIRFLNKEIERKKRYSVSYLKPMIGQELLLNQLTTTSLPLYQDRMLEDMCQSNTVYLSYGDLYYQKINEKKISVAPLVFFKVKVIKKDAVYYLVSDRSSPMFNTVLQDYLLKNYRLDLQYEYFGFDYARFMRIQNEKVSSLSFSIDSSFHLINLDIERDLRLQAVISLDDKRFLETNPVYRHLEGEVKNDGKEESVADGEHFSFVNKGLFQLERDSIVHVKEINAFEQTFVKDLIADYILKKKNVLFVSSSSKKDWDIRKEMSSFYYDGLIPYCKVYQAGSALFTLLKSRQKQKSYLPDTDLVMKKQRLLAYSEDLLNNDRKLKQIQVIGQDSDEQGCSLYLESLEKAKKTYTFSPFGEYTYQNYLSDKDFLDFIKDNSYFTEVSFSNHPFNGLSSFVQYSEYDDIVALIKKTIEDYSEFNKAIEEAKIRLTQWNPFTSLRGYDSAISAFSIFLKYAGFTKKYLEMNYTPDILADIEKLKEIYRLKASISLSLDMACKPDVWNEDFNFISQNKENRKEEKLIKKRFKNYIKIPPFKKTYKNVLVLIEKYALNERELEEVSSRLVELFGEDTKSLDGLLYVDKAYGFLQNYNEHVRLYKEFDFTNDFVKEFFNNHEFSSSFINVYYPNLVKLRATLNSELDKLKEVFRYDSFDYVVSSFEEAKAHLEFKLNSSKADFDNSLSFAKKLDDTSTPLKACVSKFEKEDRNFANFKNDFEVSIYRYLLLQSMEENEGGKTIEDNSKILDEFYAGVDSESSLLDLGFLSSFDNIKNQIISKPSFNQTLAQLSKEYHTNPLYSFERALKVGGNILYHLYPLETISMEDSYALHGYKFNLVILLMDSSVSLEDFYYALSLGEKVVVIDTERDYPSLSKLDLSLKDNLNKFVSVFDLESRIKKQILKAFKRHNIELIKDRIVDFNLKIPSYFEYSNEKYCLFIQTSAKNINDVDAYLLPTFLYNYYKIKVVNLYLLPFMVYEDFSIVCLCRNIDELKKEASKAEKKKDSLTYEEKKKADYFATLDAIDKEFLPYSSRVENIDEFGLIVLQRSTLDERSIVSISEKELANGIITYLKHFTYLSRDVLIRHLSNIVGTNEKDIDFIQLFLKAEELLLNRALIIKKENRLAIYRR